MPRYLLSFCIYVAILSGSARSSDDLSEPPTYGEKALQQLRTFYGKPLAERTSDEPTDAARRQGKDYGALIVAATYKDRKALSTLMTLGSMDGEAGDGHAANLTLLLRGLGDDFFSSVLKSQRRAVREGVSLDLWWDSDLKAHCPKTYGMRGNE